MDQIAEGEIAEDARKDLLESDPEWNEMGRLAAEALKSPLWFWRDKIEGTQK